MLPGHGPSPTHWTSADWSQDQDHNQINILFYFMTVHIEVILVKKQQKHIIIIYTNFPTGLCGTIQYLTIIWSRFDLTIIHQDHTDSGTISPKTSIRQKSSHLSSQNSFAKQHWSLSFSPVSLYGHPVCVCVCVCVCACVCISVARCYCVILCLFTALSRGVGALQISIIII